LYVVTRPVGATPPEPAVYVTTSPVKYPWFEMVITLVAALKAELAKVLLLFVFAGNTRNLSHTFKIFAKDVPEPATNTEPASVVTVPAPTI
jgi:hypothetical protein